MRDEPYTVATTHFAYCFRVYLRCHTHRGAVVPALAALSTPQFAELADKFNIQILESSTDAKNLLLLVSLQPGESVSACASKLKGQITKRLREATGLDRRDNFLGRGYFACTSGKSTQDAVMAYLGRQGAHHGYAERVIPPVHVQEFELTPEGESRLTPAHASACLQFHIVLASWQRKGIFGSMSGPAVTACWRRLEAEHRFALLKVSFVPDHIHIALRLHPDVAPAQVAVALMNAAADLMYTQFREHLIQGGLNQLWQPSAYIGGYGDVSSKMVKGYIRKWEAEA